MAASWIPTTGDDRIASRAASTMGSEKQAITDGVVAAPGGVFASIKIWGQRGAS